MGGDAADSPILREQGTVAFFAGDLDHAGEIADRARQLLQSPDDPWHWIDLVGLQGMIAHRRGELFERFRLEMRRTSGRQRLAEALFDAHLCVAEFMLRRRMPYSEVIADAEQLRRSAEEVGALRGMTFATALIGEAALLTDDLDRAERELLDAIDLHRESAVPATSTPRDACWRRSPQHAGRRVWAGPGESMRTPLLWPKPIRGGRFTSSSSALRSDIAGPARRS